MPDLIPEASGNGQGVSSVAMLRLLSWLSPTFPSGAYSYSHGLEWAVEAAYVSDRESLVDWLDADLRFGSARNEAIFFGESHRYADQNDLGKLAIVAELAAAYRGTAEFALESSQQAGAFLSTLRRVWPDTILDDLASFRMPPTVAVVVGARTAKERIPLCFALHAFLHNYAVNLVNAGVRLVPLGQTDGQRALAELEPAILHACRLGAEASVDDLGSAGFSLEICSIAHETQYTRLFRS
jgi:urease accessory protein